MTTYAAAVLSLPASVPKDTFKSTKRDKAAGEGVYSFAENFFRVTKDKPAQQIEEALMSLCSDDDELAKFLQTYSSSGLTTYFKATVKELVKQSLLCSLRSQFLKPTNHILVVRDVLLAKEIKCDIFRLAPSVWVGAILERFRTVQTEDVGHSNEQFMWVICRILGKLHSRFNIQKIEDNFRAEWCHDPSSVPECVGAIIAMNIQQIEMSGIPGDTSRDLRAMLRCYNSGRTTSVAANQNQVSTYVPKLNFNRNNSYNNNSNYAGNNQRGRGSGSLQV